MRAEMKVDMKRVKGMLPATIGVAMALLSGMAKAEDKAAKPQPLAGAVSTQTTLPSVGHRPVITDAGVYADSSMQKDITDNATIIPVGGKLFVDVRNVSDPDSDDLTSDFICNVFAIEADNTETLLADAVSCSKNADGSIPLSIANNIAGKKVAVDIYANSDLPVAQGKGYLPVPDKSLAYRITSSNQVTPPLIITGREVMYRLDDSNFSTGTDILKRDVNVLYNSPEGNSTGRLIVEGGVSPYSFVSNDPKALSVDAATGEFHFNDTVLGKKYIITVFDDIGHSVEWVVQPKQVFNLLRLSGNYDDAVQLCKSKGMRISKSKEIVEPFLFSWNFSQSQPNIKYVEQLGTYESISQIPPGNSLVTYKGLLVKTSVGTLLLYTNVPVKSSLDGVICVDE
ncbi:hypothetical protein KWI08_08925 [Morganella morganii]|uniref:hypothetical protein n=1 Tax=Morganella morganii TaxID=582 RepID=UPI0021D22519|nr:hypothetical protein [Morganella morganii]MCU6274018.1 hypothetical protein [Morganella morganii]